MILIYLAIVLCALGFIWFFPQYYLNSYKIKKIKKTELIDLENKLRLTVSQIIGGTLVLIGIFVTYNNNLSIKFKQDTEILSNCLKQLGDNNQAIRLGAIHTLNKLADNSDTDKRIVFKIYCDYISNDSTSKMQKEAELILNIIGANNFIKSIPDIKGINISNSRFSKLRVSNLDFTGLTFSQCRFDSCIFELTSFENSVIQAQKLKDCYFMSCNFRGVMAVGSEFTSCNLTGSDFTGARLNGALFSDCILRRCNFKESNFGFYFDTESLTSYRKFMKVKHKYEKTRIEESDLTEVLSLNADTTITLVSNKGFLDNK